MISKLIVVILSALALAPAIAAGPALTWQLQAPADSGYLSNTAIDGLNYADRIWLATGKGLNVSANNGQSWAIINKATGLVSENVSALFAQEDRVWVGTSHIGAIEDQFFTLSDGVSYSDDTGKTWTQVNFGSTGLNIPYVWGGDRVVYDITGLVDTTQEGRINHWLWFGAFAGGLLASQDNGESWRRIWATPDDSVQYNTSGVAPSYRNLLFSCVADKSHPDSVFLWAGTASGVFQYIHVPRREKLGVRETSEIAFCDTCTATGGTFVFLGGRRALSRGRTTGGPFISRFEGDGLPGTQITAVATAYGKVYAGTANEAGSSTGLAVSNDQGNTFAALPLPVVTGTNQNITDLVLMNSRLYLAAETAGLMVSADSGTSWARILIDSTVPARATNTVNAVNAWGDTLLVGTDSGVVFLTLAGDGGIIQNVHFPFAENATSSARVVKIRPQAFLDTSAIPFDSVAIWTAHRAVSGGTPIVGRFTPRDTVIVDTTTPPDGIPDTVIFGNGTWQNLQVGAITHDINFLGDTAFAVGSEGIRYSTNGLNPSVIFTVTDSLNGALNLTGDTVRVMAVRGDTVVFGSDRSVAFSPNRAKKFRIFTPNLDSLKADVVVNFTALNTADFSGQGRYGLTGDFLPALAVQPMSVGPARVWASGRPVEFGVNGISMGQYKVDSLGVTRMSWRSMYEDDFAWNFAFKDSLVFAATNVGLLLRHLPEPYSIAADTLPTWDTVALVNSEGKSLVNPGASTYAVEVVDSFLWVGTDDGTIRLNLGDLKGELFTVIDSTTAPDQVYAFPVPFSPLQEQLVKFHFVVPADGNVTLEIYDFAMNLVARPIDNVFYTAGVYPNNSGPGATWNGHNDKGDRVAVGVYYFKVKFPSGDERWGKLAVIP